MSDITRVEKFLRASIDGVPCSLKPITRVEKLLAELNEAIAGPAPTVILPETELVKDGGGFRLLTPPNAYPEVGKTYTATLNGESYEVTALESSNGMTVLAMEGEPFAIAFLPDEYVATLGCYVVAEYEENPPDTLTLSIVEAVEESGSAGGGGGLFIVRGTMTPETETRGTCTLDKTLDEIIAAANTGNVVQCHLALDTNTVIVSLGSHNADEGFAVFSGFIDELVYINIGVTAEAANYVMWVLATEAM